VTFIAKIFTKESITSATTKGTTLTSANASDITS